MQLSRWGFLYIHLLIQFHFRTSFSLSRVRWEATSFLSRFLTPNFNPPIPCGMGHVSHFQSDMMAIFQFTHPVWDGTRLAAVFGNVQGYFNPPIPCGMGPVCLAEHRFDLHISIHPSRVGWDPGIQCGMRSPSYFNPPIPCGMGRKRSRSYHHYPVISIHPSRVGWDATYFNTPLLLAISIHPSRVGWDKDRDPQLYGFLISIHPSRVGWDCR